MANIFVSAGASAIRGRLAWDLTFDDVANTVTINAVHTRPNGSPAPDPLVAIITVTLEGGASVSVDLLTGLLNGGAPFVQGSPGKMINAGPKTRTSVRLTVSADRAASISFATEYQQPAT